MKKQHLEPCPFCKSGATMHDIFDSEHCAICDACAACGPVELSRDAAAAAWNARAAVTPEQRTCRVEHGYPGGSEPGAFVPQDMHPYCSNCGGGMLADPYTGRWPGFCPHCGAKVVG